MKIRIVHVFAALALCAALFADPAAVWEPDPAAPVAASRVADISLAGDVGVAVTTDGAVMVTADRGEQWLSVSPAEQLGAGGVQLQVQLEVCAMSHKRIIVAGTIGGNPGVIASSNGGRDWATAGVAWRQQEPDAWSVEAITFEDGNSPVAVAVGWRQTDGDPYEALVLRTADGGSSWQEMGTPDLSAMPAFARYLNGVAFTELPPTPRLTHRQASYWVVCSPGGALKYSSGLERWLDVSGTSIGYEVTSMYDMPDSPRAWITNSEGDLLALRGHAVEEVLQPTPGYLSDVAFASETHGIVVTPHGIHMTVDGGQTWTGAQIPTIGAALPTTQLQCCGAFGPGSNVFRAFRCGMYSPEVVGGGVEHGGYLLRYGGRPIVPRVPIPRLPRGLGN